MRVVFLTEAGRAQGYGHLSRCCALYDALAAMGGSCELVVAGDVPGHIVEERCARAFEWRDADVVTMLSRDADAVVIDSYLAPLGVYVAASSAARVAVYLDDTARLQYPAGIVVNGNPEAGTLGWSGDADRLLGVQYQLVRAEFANALPHVIGETVGCVLIMSGGTDAGRSLEGFSAAARRAYPDATLRVVDTPQTARELRGIMAGVDIAVTAAGQTLYELAALGVPTVAVVVADNQLSQAHAFASADAVLLAGEWKEPGTQDEITRLLRALETPAARARQSAAGSTLVDARGAERVAQRLGAYLGLPETGASS